MFQVTIKILQRSIAVLMSLGLLCGGMALADEQAKPVKVGLVKTMDVPLFLDRVGALTAVSVVEVVPLVSALVAETHFKEGQMVKKGQLLFSLDASIYQAKLAQAKAALGADTAQLNEAKKQVARQERLQKKDYVTQQALEEARSQVAIYTAQLEEDRATIRLAEINLGYCSITAPISGRTGLIKVQPGNLASTDSDTPLTTIYQSDTLFVDFDIPETYLEMVRTKAQAGELSLTVHPAGDATRTHQGKTTYLAPSVDSDTGTLQIRGVVENRDGSLWPGHFVQVRLVLRILKDAVVAPSSAVQQNQEGNYVYLMGADSKAQFRKVTAGQVYGDWQVIDKGLEQGDQVITFGQLNLRPGIKVKPVDEKADKAAPKAKAGESR